MCMDWAFPALPGTVRQCGDANQAGVHQVQVLQCAHPTVRQFSWLKLLLADSQDFLLLSTKESNGLSRNDNFVNAQTRKLGSIQADRARTAKPKGETEMSRKQN